MESVVLEIRKFSGKFLFKFESAVYPTFGHGDVGYNVMLMTL